MLIAQADKKKNEEIISVTELKLFEREEIFV